MLIKQVRAGLNDDGVVTLSDGCVEEDVNEVTYGATKDGTTMMKL